MPRETRRDALRAAALYVLDEERQATGFDRRIQGSLDFTDALGYFEEFLDMNPLTELVGPVFSDPAEASCWERVHQGLEPLWTSRTLDEAKSSAAWLALELAVRRCVDRHGLWHEEIAYPVSVTTGDEVLSVSSWPEVERLPPSLLEHASIRDARGRRVQVSTDPVHLVKVGLPQASNWWLR